ncbi:carboxypeptidase family protein [Chitinophaga skermanii]|uniref:Carboxypeptidase family protein n=1 Tax=Chitinophaga skermanii TaxID=331697 RepID=A0A327QWQ9_9BACT|nr:TonB-dependent receptor [Chitinophaga skermanii]RAJ08318.1 carboxypeptidase family protein [Chitinophaga skermanii]
MKNYTLLVLLCLFFCMPAIAQTAVTGQVKDTALQVPMPRTAVMLLQAKDSMLVAHTRTADDGSFAFRDVQPGHYIVLVSRMPYADFAERITVAASPYTVGLVPLVSRTRLLREVVINKQQAAIKIKGDTTEYNAAAFELQKGASVEDLLKQLPGMQVDRNGVIIAQGEIVKKVLVEGEEFFGDDPLLVTRNLRADMVDKVQLYDKKSDLAAATGINDGIKDKTINLKLKEDAKRGSFGKVEIGGGPEGFFDNQAMVNIFRGKRRFAAYGTLSNTGKIGLGSQDNDKYQLSKDESTMRDSELDSWSGTYEGQGLPLSQSGGIHYADKWNEDKSAVSLNYKLAGLHIDGAVNTISQQSLPTDVLVTNIDQVFKQQVFKHKLHGNYETRFDSAWSFRLVMAGATQHKKMNNFFSSSTVNNAQEILNSGTRRFDNTVNNGGFNTAITLARALKLKGSSITLQLDQQYNASNAEGTIRAENRFPNDITKDSLQVLDQQRKDAMRDLGLEAKLIYVRPISARSVLSFNYGINHHGSSSDIRAWAPGKQGYENPDSLISNSFKYNRTINRAGVQMIYGSPKLHMNFGTDVALTHLQQENQYTGQRYPQNFVNWYPAAEIAYVIKLQQSVSVYFKGDNNMPGIEQLQPVVNNADPLNVIYGNADLHPYFTGTWGVRYNHFQPAGEKYFFSNFNFSRAKSQITSSVVTDEDGRNFITWSNDGNSKKFWAYIGTGKKILKWDAHTGLNLNASVQSLDQLSNKTINTVTNNSYGAEYYFNKSIKQKLDLNLKFQASYNTNKTSLQPEAPVNYWLYNINPSTDIYFLKAWQLHADASWMIRQKTAVFTGDMDVLLVNAFIGRRLDKEGNWNIRASVNDLLNQQRGFNRFVQGNFITQQQYTTVQRYFLLSLLWNFSKLPTANNQ